MSKRYSYIHSKYLPPPDPYPRIMKIELIFLIVIFITFASTFFPFASNAQVVRPVIVVNNEKQAVLGASVIEIPITVTPVPTEVIMPTEIPTPIPTIPVKSARKSAYSIAIYGDSMVDTMGERGEYLEHALKRLYPSVSFALYNYGKGSENVDTGLNRWNSRLDYQDRHYFSITEVKPDIIILGSYAYNPFSPYNRDRHWLELTELVKQAKNITPNVYILAEIAPLRKDFGKGPNGVNWDEQTAYEHSGRIVEQLENAVGLARTLNVSLIDVFHQSIGKSGLNNPGDGIHASVAGHEFTAGIIAETIVLD